MIDDEHRYRHDRHEQDIQELKRELRTLQDGPIRKLENFRRMILVSLVTVFGTVTYVSVEGWELLRKLFTRH